MAKKPLLLVLLVASLGSSVATAQAVAPAVQRHNDDQADTRIKRLFEESDEAYLKRNPLEAILRGDLRFADSSWSYLTETYYQAERAAIVHDLAKLATIDSATLTPTNKIAYDVFKSRNETDLAGYANSFLHIRLDLPLDHMNGFQAFYPDFASGKGGAPFNTAVDYDNNLKRNAQYALVLDRAANMFKKGMNDRIVQPKLVVTNMIQELDTLIGEGVEGSTFYNPVKVFPASIASNEQDRLRAAYATQVRDVLIPAHKRLRDFLAREYLPAARDSVGLSDLPGGTAYYDYLIRQNTTTEMTADQVHAAGLSEVARIRNAMTAQKQAVGFQGDLAAFFTFLQTNKAFQPVSAAAVHDAYEQIEKRVYRRIPE